MIAKNCTSIFYSVFVVLGVNVEKMLEEVINRVNSCFSGLRRILIPSLSKKGIGDILVCQRKEDRKIVVLQFPPCFLCPSCCILPRPRKITSLKEFACAGSLDTEMGMDN